MKALPIFWFVFALGACVAKGPVEVSAEGEGERPRFPLCETPPGVIACDPIFDDTLCPPESPSPPTGRPCTDSLVCTYCGYPPDDRIIVDGKLTLQCNLGGDSWSVPRSCFEED
jgi:hypothetical protein